MNPITSSIRENACENFERKRNEVRSAVRSAEKLAKKQNSKIKSAKKEVQDTLSEVEKTLAKIDGAAEQASSISVGNLKKFVKSQAKSAQKAVSEKISSVSQAVRDGAKEKTEGAAISLNTSALATAQQALAPELAGIKSSLAKEVASVTALVDLYMGGPEQIFLVVLDFLSQRLIQNMREMRETLRSFDIMAQKIIKAILLAKEAAGLLSNNNKRRPSSFITAADYIDEAVAELRFKTNFSANQEGFHSSAFVGRAIEHLEKAKGILPEPQTLDEKVKEGYSLLDQSASLLKEVGAESVSYTKNIKTLAESYGDALFMAFLIRNLPKNIVKGFQLASAIGSKKILSNIIDGLEERSQEMRRFASSSKNEEKINLRAIYERAQLDYYLLQLTSMKGVLAGSISDSYDGVAEEIKALAEDPFFFGCGESLVEIETYGKYITGMKSIPSSRYDGLLSAARQFRLSIKKVDVKLEALISKAKQRRPNDPSLKTFRLLMKKFAPQLSVDQPMVAIASGTFAVQVVEKFENNKKEESSEEKKTAQTTRLPYSKDRPYFKPSGNGASQASLAAEKEASKMEKEQVNQGIEKAISEAAERDRLVRKTKRDRLSTINY